MKFDYTFLVNRYLTHLKKQHVHTLTATSLCHQFKIEDPESVKGVQKCLRKFVERGKLSVLDQNKRYARNQNRPANLYLIEV